MIDSRDERQEETRTLKTFRKR